VCFLPTCQLLPILPAGRSAIVVLYRHVIFSRELKTPSHRYIQDPNMHSLTLFHVLFTILASLTVLATSVLTSDSLTTADTTYLDVIELMRTHSAHTMNHTIMYRTFTGTSHDTNGPLTRLEGTSGEFEDIAVQAYNGNRCSGGYFFEYPMTIGLMRTVTPQIKSFMLSRHMTEYEVINFYGFGAGSTCSPFRYAASGLDGFPQCWTIGPASASVSCYDLWKW